MSNQAGSIGASPDTGTAQTAFVLDPPAASRSNPQSVSQDASAPASQQVPQPRSGSGDHRPRPGASPAPHAVDRWYDRAGIAAFTVALAACALEPIVIQLFWRRVVDHRLVASAHDWTAVQSSFTHWATVVGLVFVGIALARPARLLRLPHRSLVAAALLWVVVSAVNTRTGARHATDASNEIAALAVLSALVLLPRPRAGVVLSQIRLWLGVYVYGSLVAAVVSPSWALVPVPDGTGAPWGRPRLWGISDHPNHLAPLAALLLVLELTGRGSRLRRVLNGTAAVVVVLLTGTLTSAVCLAVALGYLALLQVQRSSWRPSRARMALTGLVGLVLATGVLLTIRPDLLRKWHILLSADGRTRIWQAAIHVWWDHPLLGYGPYVFDRTAQLQYLGPNTANLGSAHSQYLQAFAQGGLVLGAVLCIYVGVLIWKCRVGRGLAGSVVATAACLVLLTTMATEVALRGGPNSAFFLLHAVVLLIVLSVAGRGTASTPPATDGADERPVSPGNAVVAYSA